jgi:hypothetical protein
MGRVVTDADPFSFDVADPNHSSILDGISENVDVEEILLNRDWYFNVGL